jgi:hypothetical protein
MNEKRVNSQNASDPRLPLRGNRKPARHAILASHLVFTGYAHWLSNDLRGSGSVEIRKDTLKSLGEILPGRQFPQPPRDEVRQFHRDAAPLLDHPRFDDRMRQTIAEAFGEAARIHGYTSGHARCAPITRTLFRAHIGIGPK